MTTGKRRWWITGGLLMAIVLALALTEPRSPDGRYVTDPRIGAEGDHFWEFAEGKVFFVQHLYENTEFGWEAETDRIPEPRRYANTKEGWFMFSDSRSSNVPPLRIEYSWIGLWVTEPDGPPMFLRRRLIPGFRPHWMLDWLPWWVQ
jgi:hypothetical protein